MKRFFHSLVAAATAVALSAPAGAWAANEEKPKTELPSKKEEGKDKDNEVKKERRASEIFQGSISVKNFSRQNTGEVVTRARGSSESTLFLRSLSQDRDREKKITTGRSSDELALVRVIGGGNSGVSDGMTGEKVGTSGVDDGSKSRDGEKRTTSTQSPVTPPHTSFSSSSLRTRILGGGGILSTFFSSPSRQRGRAGSPVRYVSTPKQHVPQAPPPRVYPPSPSHRERDVQADRGCTVALHTHDG